MKCALAILALILGLNSRAGAADRSALDLVGKWEGAVEFGKFKFTLVLRIATNAAGRIETTIDVPEQGQKGLHADALLFNAPEVRLELDQFGTAYNGKVNDALTEIDGQFEEGPGGRPANLVFKRSTQADAPEPEKTYTFANGEPPDIRGYWKGEIELGPPGMKVLAALNIGRIPDGTFRATLDLPEQGAKEIPASSVSTTNRNATLKWQGFQGAFAGTLSEDGKELSGSWIQMGKTNPLAFSRLDAPLQLLRRDLSYSPDGASAEDIRGYWKGALDVAGRKLRLVVKVGRAPDGTYGGTLASLDQGGQELPASTASYSDSTLKMEWRGIRGKYEGTVSKDGTSIEGKFEQFGNPIPLKLERTTEKQSKT